MTMTASVPILNLENIPGDITNVPGHKFLFYSPSTRYVYDVAVEGDCDFLSPFTTCNNNYCQFLDGEVVEVVGNKIIGAVDVSYIS